MYPVHPESEMQSIKQYLRLESWPGQRSEADLLLLLLSLKGKENTG